MKVSGKLYKKMVKEKDRVSLRSATSLRNTEIK